MLSLSEENYLKAIYHLQSKSKTTVSTTLLSEHIKNKASSVTDMLKKLSEKKLVEYKKYQGVKLSSIGEKKALKIIRKHRLWEVFLVEKLNFNWDEVHEVAEQLEHIKSEKLTEELDRFLNYPKRDPHGDPIPNQNGEFEVLNKTLLSELEPNESGICVGLRDTSSAFLTYLDKQGIALGKDLKVIEKEPFDESMLIEFEQKKLRISGLTAHNLYIKQK
jgi:DtxR family Mn-dependent transcriptional regulator